MNFYGGKYIHFINFYDLFQYRFNVNKIIICEKFTHIIRVCFHAIYANLIIILLSTPYFSFLNETIFHTKVVESIKHIFVIYKFTKNQASLRMTDYQNLTFKLIEN